MYQKDDKDDVDGQDDDGHSSISFCKQITCTIPETPKTKWNEWHRKEKERKIKEEKQSYTTYIYIFPNSYCSCLCLWV